MMIVSENLALSISEHFFSSLLLASYDDDSWNLNIFVEMLMLVLSSLMR